MQEDVERRTAALYVNATRLTGRNIGKGLTALLRKIQDEAANTQGKSHSLKNW